MVRKFTAKADTMKCKLFYACFVAVLVFTSCESREGTDASANNADTAVLVDDPVNMLDANPVNDTYIADTVQTK